MAYIDRRKETKKQKTNIWQRILAVVGILLILGGFANPEENSSVSTKIQNGESRQEGTGDEVTDSLEVHFLDVGQGDATLIKTGDAAMLIDAGSGSKGTAIQLYLQKQGVEKLDYLILTHADTDHSGGADVIITKFDVGEVLIGGSREESQWEAVKDASEYKRVSYYTPEVGREYFLGDAEFTILSPDQIYSEDNNNSIVLKLVHGENVFLFTGDCEEEAEKDILKREEDIDCDVYKVGHHGSSSSSSVSFVQKASPIYGVISCGENNAYGHPHADTLNTLRAQGVQIFRTDEQGSVIAYSDGQKISWNCAPSESWKAGEYRKEDISEKDAENEEQVLQDSEITYICNKNPNSMKFHYPACEAVSKMSKHNKLPVSWTREEVIEQGYSPCGNCKP